IWFPDVPAEPAYPNLALSVATDWDGFLEAYRSGTPTPIPTGARAERVDISVPPDGLADVIRVEATPPMNGTIVIVLSEGSAIVASTRSPSQTANLVRDTSPADAVNLALLALAATGLTLAVILGAIVLWQRNQIQSLRGRPP